MNRFIREYLLAVQFFTRIPVTGRLVGALAAAVFTLLQAALPDTLLSLVLVLLLALLGSVEVIAEDTPAFGG